MSRWLKNTQLNIKELNNMRYFENVIATEDWHVNIEADYDNCKVILTAGSNGEKVSLYMDANDLEAIIDNMNAILVQYKKEEERNA